MFAPQDTPRLMAVPAGCDFARSFSDGLLGLAAHHPPEMLGRVEVYVNTRRMAREIRAHLTKSGARLLPRLRLVTDLGGLATLPRDLPEPAPPLRRQLQLAQLVGALLQAEQGMAPQSAKFELAGTLAALMDEMQGEGVAMAALTELETGDQSGHWERSLRFLSIIARHWDATPGSDPQDRARLAALALAESWEADPPQHPVIVAGSTGSRAQTAIFMQAVARLPQGAVVLPGWDDVMPASVWAKMENSDLPADHPQSPILSFCRAAGADPSSLPVWGDAAPLNRDRAALVSLSLRPAPFTDQWIAEGPALRSRLTEALAGLSVQEASTPREEALAVALRLREAAEHGQRAVLISPDRELTRRVAATLKRWGITPDDSAGRPLHQTPPGIFLRLVAACIGQPLTPLALVSILKHPLCGSGNRGAGLRRFVREFEAKHLRGGPPSVDWDALTRFARDDAERLALVAWIRGTLEPLAGLRSGDTETFLRAHHTAAETLAAGPGTPESGTLWEAEDGEGAAEVFADLLAEAGVADTPSSTDYRALFDTVLTARQVRDPRRSHPLVAFWGTLEARVGQADLMILGGLNDTIWPGPETPDPWLNRTLRRRLGLLPPERTTGLSAHDFQQAVCAPRVVLSRATRDGEAPTVPSRWLARLFNLIEGLGDDAAQALAQMRAEGAEWLRMARAMDRPAQAVAPEPRPAPAPPMGARFGRLSVTQVEKLIRDPYAVYAERTLRLRKLNPLGQEADALLRGQALHAVVEGFAESLKDGITVDPVAALMDCADVAFEKEVPWASVRRIWGARLERVAAWLAEEELARRDAGIPVGIEVKGRRKLSSHGVELIAKADRIDRLHDGRLAIFDFKSGKVPTEAEIEFFKKQLHLEAAIAAQGGFEGIDPAETALLEYIPLSGSGLEENAKPRKIPFSMTETEAIWAEFLRLVASYHAKDTGFAARPRMQKMQYAYDFDHLARFGEWTESDDFVTFRVGDHP